MQTIFSVSSIGNMTSFGDLIRQRRSMRKYTEEAVSGEQEKVLLKAALMAPSSKGTHSPEFIVVRDRDKLKALSACKTVGADFLADAAMAIVVMADPSVSDVWIEDASVAASFILLQAEDLGLGSCWIQVRERTSADGRSAAEVVRETLSVPVCKEPLCIVALGHKGMERKPQNEERLKWDKVHIAG